MPAAAGKRTPMPAEEAAASEAAQGRFHDVPAEAALAGGRFHEVPAEAALEKVVPMAARDAFVLELDLSNLIPEVARLIAQVSGHVVPEHVLLSYDGRMLQEGDFLELCLVVRGGMPVWVHDGVALRAAAREANRRSIL